MKRISTIVWMLAMTMMVIAQTKMTPQAQLAVARQKAKAQKEAALARGTEAVKTPMATVVVKIDQRHAAQTVGQLKAAGATVRSAIGQQAVLTLPLDSVAALDRIEGVMRIDKGHKGRLKTDVARQATGVSQLNGPTAAETARTFTGKGVNLCLMDIGIDFQHPAFKDAEGRSRIKCVYNPSSSEGRPFSVSDPVWGEYTLPGSVFDTPELIATLTTDSDEGLHGTHTLGIAAGSLSPQGFGGMAPEADLVLVPMAFFDEDEYDDSDDVFETALAFMSAYARESDQPSVLSASLNSHGGPHNGTGTVVEAIEAASRDLIPVFSAGNEGSSPIHLYQKFTSTKSSVQTILAGMMEDEEGKFTYLNSAEVSGYTRAGSEVSVQLSLLGLNMLSHKISTVWTSQKVTATPGCEEIQVQTSSEEDATLAKYFTGEVGLAAADTGNGSLEVAVMVDGGQKSQTVLYLFVLTISGSEGTEIDLWDDTVGFGGTELIGLPGYVDGDNEMSGGDWTCTDRVISVGAYCSNVIERKYDGTTEDTSYSPDPEDDVYVLDDIAYFSSYGTSFNDITQPVVCAPGVNVVSSINHYYIEDEDVAESMMWQDYPYGADSGTSMACPVVAGIVALLLEADPTLDLDGVKQVLAETSVNDDFTAADPVRWGYGKISATEAIKYITGQSQGISDRQLAPASKVLYDLQGRRIDRRPAAGIYISNGRKTIVR